MKKHNIFKTIFIYSIIFIFIFLLLLLYNSSSNNSQNGIKYTYDTLISDIKSTDGNDIHSINLETNEKLIDLGKATIIFNSGSSAIIDIPSISAFMNLVHSSNNTDLLSTSLIEKPSSFFTYLLYFLIALVIIIVLFNIMQQSKGGGGGGKVLSFGKNKAKVLTDAQKTTRFKDVAALKEEKYDLEEIVSFLKEPKKFEEIGARIPKGILLVGPPGTGKTLLARAIAGEAGVHFFTISGSDFVEMFVGVGASRVRDMFEEAKKNKPCLIFIDEIDAVGRRRGSGLGGGHDEREQTLNQLLVEMDGFTTNEGIIIIAATNRVDILDPALLRPGRFDRQIYIGLPDVKGREEILKVHAKNKKLEDNVNLSEISRITSGFTGAELENLLNESAILAAKADSIKISMEDIRRSFIKIGIGTEKKSHIVSLEERKITAYHEAGHAILTEMLPLIDEVHIISIIPTGTAGGYTMHLPIDKGYISKNFLLQELIVLFGGRIAEDIIFGDITTGASSDIERASKIARSMVIKYGMSPLGPIEFNKDTISDNISNSIDDEISSIITYSYKEAERILNENINYLHSCANLLLEKEKISGDEFRELFPKNYLPIKKTLTYPESSDKNQSNPESSDKNQSNPESSDKN